MPRQVHFIDSEAHTDRLRLIRWIVTDVDGVLTDGSLHLIDEESEAKSFSVRDGLGVWMAHQCGLHVAILTGRPRPVVTRRCQELGIDAIYGCAVDAKGLTMERLCREQSIDPVAALYIGDDIIDLPAMKRCGFSVAPRDADHLVASSVDALTRADGGHGVLREVVDAVLKAQGTYQSLLRDTLGVSVKEPERD